MGTLKRDSWGTYTLTAAQLAALKSGYGLCLYEEPHSYSGSYSPGYTRFYSLGSDYEPVLTVTYNS